MNFLVSFGVLVVLGVVWGLASVSRSKEILRLRSARAQARTVLTTYARSAMLQNSLTHIIAVAGEVASEIFGANELYLIEEGEQGAHTGVAVAEIKVPQGPHVAANLGRGPRADARKWFASNPEILFAADVQAGKAGGMASHLRSMMASCHADVLVPLVHKQEVLGVLGLNIGRNPSDLDRELMRIFGLEVIAACANVHLHQEVSHLHSLVDEVNVATGLDLSLIPKELSGRVGKFKWNGHYCLAEQAGSDFWGVYPLSENRVFIVIGDSVGRRLAGAMVSASVKSCCDQVIADKGDSLSPGELLSILNASLFRATHSALASCFAAVLDPARSQLTYANAGHVLSYRARKGKDGLALTVLQGAGPLLGDLMDPKFPVHKEQLANSDSVILLTDGLLAQRDAQGDAYGYRRFHKLLKAQGTTDPEDIKKAVLADIARHSADDKPRDDQALLVLKWA